MNIQDKSLKFDSERLGLYQIRQYQHDILYHADIVALGMVRRLTHVALHLSKYAYGISLERDNERFKKDYIDSFIMIISAANILNLDMSELDNSNSSSIKGSFLSNYLYFSSVFSKSCESYDHFEKHNFHKNWEDAIISLFMLFEEDALSNDIDIILSANSRLDEVENKIMSANIKFKIETKLKSVK